MAQKPIYLFIIPFFPSENNHVGSYIYDQVMAVKATGKFDVKVIMPNRGNANTKQYSFGGIEVYRFRERNLPSAIWPGFFDKSNKKSFDACLESIDVNFNDIYIVHAHITRLGQYALHIKKKNPNVLTLLQHHGYDVLSIGDGMFSKFRWHKRHTEEYGVNICNNIDINIGVSRATLESFNKYKKIKIKDSYVLYNGVDVNKFHRLQNAKKNIQFTIGCIANFWEIKDHITLIKAVENLVKNKNYDIKAILVGVGATLRECQEYVKTHKLSNHVEFQLPMKHDKLIEFYNSLDLFVLPSYWDTLGCVYLEAYACGVPFMSAEGTGIKELIPESDRHRWIAPKSNPGQLALMIKNYIDNRYKQVLSSPIDIKYFIEHFLHYIEQKKIESI